MSQENVQVAREVLGAVGRLDLPRLTELTDAEIEWQSFFADLSEYRGHEGLRQYVRDLGEAFEWLRPEESGMLGVGDLVIGVGRIHYRGKESGIEADAPAGWAFSFQRRETAALPGVPRTRTGPRSRRTAGVAMSQENVETVKRWIEFYNRRDTVV